MTAGSNGASVEGGVVRRLARAKVNLCLHVVGRRPDGYHLLDSLVVFPELGDRLSVEPSAGLSLALDGPYGWELDAGPDNLVLRAALSLQQAAFPSGGRAGPPPGAALSLEKNLPVASGVGGGSSDAAAALSALSALWDVRLDAAALDELALGLGADVPVCLRAPAPARMRGIGEEVRALPATPPFWMTLVNPGVPVSTPDVFGALRRRDNPPAPPTPEEGFARLDDFVGWLAETRNDLEAPARATQPVIDACLDALRGARSCRLARMSGSGATCFGVFAAQDAALAAADALRSAHPDWWIAAGPVAAGAS